VAAAAAGLLGVALLGGCATSNAAGPYARPMPVGMSCKSVKQELNQLDRRGVRSKVEAISAGRRISADARKDADRYNYLLSVYLGAQCHS
jgi:hypothetical protein